MTLRDGRIVSFDDVRGLGIIEDDEGVRYRFHSTAIDDGSRRVGEGARVAFEPGAAPGGTVDAVAVHPLERPPRLPVSVRALHDEERAPMLEELGRRWGDDMVVARGERIELAGLEALVAVTPSGDKVGLLSYRVSDDSLEIVTLDAFAPGRGVGSALLAAARSLLAERQLRRLFLITTNDNVPALSFYLRNGLRMVAVHHNSVSWSRVVKPSIPARAGGIEVSDEIEFELLP